MKNDKTHIATVIKAHGVHGSVKVFSEVEDLSFFKKTIESEDGKLAVLKTCKRQKDNVWILQIEGITKMEQAEGMRGVKFYCKTEDFPKLKSGEFYEFEVIGFDVFEEGSEVSIGKLEEFVHFPAGKILIVNPLDKNIQRGNLSGGKLLILRDDVVKFEDGKVIIKELKIYSDVDKDTDFDDQEID